MKLSSLMISAVTLTTASTQAQELISPNDSGIIELSISNGKINNVNKRNLHDISVSEEFKGEKSQITWNINIPEKKSYIVEQTYSAPAPKNTCVFLLNDKKILENPIATSWHWNAFITTRAKKITLPPGQHKFQFKISNPSESNLNLAFISLIPSELEKTILELQRKNFLGATKDEIDLAYGKGVPVNQNESDFDKVSEGYTEEDKKLFESLRGRIKIYRWIPKVNYDIMAAFIDEKCIQAKINMGKEKCPLNKAMDHAKLRLGIKFEAPFGVKRDQEATCYYTDKNTQQEYILQYWGTNFYTIKDLSAAKKLK